MPAETRRKFVGLAAGAVITMPAWTQQKAAPTTKAGEKKEEEEVAPAEDLMREHGVLNRVLLIYEELIRRMQSRQDFDPRALGEAAVIVQDFVENYHEKLEEQHLFPRFRKAGKLVELVDTLQAQHAAGRAITQRLRQIAAAGGRLENSRGGIVGGIAAFVRMYRPHEAREDTVLFPAFKEIVSRDEYEELGGQFEALEDRLFGEHGFERVVERVAGIEKQLGIYELAQFTPR